MNMTDDKWFSSDFWGMIARQSVEWLVSTIPAVILIALLAYVALRVLDFATGRLKALMLSHLRRGGTLDTAELEKRVETLVGILHSLARVAVWAVVVMVLLRRLGVDIAPLLAGAGIAGLAFGFGAQELVRDVISGFFMIFENQVRAGDMVTVNGVSGLVERVDLRTIVLRDVNGTVHVFQNGKINTLANMTKDWSAVVVDVSIGHKEDVENVIGIMKAVAEEMRAEPAFSVRINAPLEVFGVESITDSAIVIKARFKTKPMQQWDVGNEYRKRLRAALDSKGVDVPCPRHLLVFANNAAPPPQSVRTAVE